MDSPRWELSNGGHGIVVALAFFFRELFFCRLRVDAQSSCKTFVQILNSWNLNQATFPQCLFKPIWCSTLVGASWAAIIQTYFNSISTRIQMTARYSLNLMCTTNGEWRSKKCHAPDPSKTRLRLDHMISFLPMSCDQTKAGSAMYQHSVQTSNQ